MAGDLLDRILREIRARKQAPQAAYEESPRLERALAALDAISAAAFSRVVVGPRAL